MSNKASMLKRWASVLTDPKVQAWYQLNMESHPQGETVSILIDAVEMKQLTLKEALSIAVIVGYQWNIKFEGIP